MRQRADESPGRGSLDGITLDAALILEVKCPTSKDSKLLADAIAGRVSVQVYWQIQTQLLVRGADLAHLYVFFDGNAGILLEQKPEPQCWDTLRQGWDRFMELIRTGQPPALQERDTVIRGDDAWLEAARAYTEAKSRADATTVELDAAKQRLLSLTLHAGEKGGGVAVTRYWKKAAVDYEKIPELQRVDVEPFRKPGRYETRVSIDEQK